MTADTAQRRGHADANLRQLALLLDELRRAGLRPGTPADTATEVRPEDGPPILPTGDAHR